MTLLALLPVTLGIVVALIRETASGPSFPAADYGSLDECLQGIPAEWLGGTIQRSGAETACRYAYAPATPAQP